MEILKGAEKIKIESKKAGRPGLGFIFIITDSLNKRAYKIDSSPKIFKIMARLYNRGFKDQA